MNKNNMEEEYIDLGQIVRVLWKYIVVILIVGILFAALLFFYRDRLRTEYEYTFTNGQMDFAQVFNNKKRKNLGTMNLKNVEAMGLVNSGSFNRYINMPGIKRSNWFVNRDAKLYYFYFQRKGVKHVIVLELTDEMVAMIRSKNYLPREAWYDAEGKQSYGVRVS
jgi:hypothetical protein